MAKRKVSYLPAGFDREQSRRQGNRPKRRNILIVCEGEKTEPNYFRSFCKRLVGGEGDRVEVVGVGDNTLSLVEAAKRIVEDRRQGDKPPFYYVWVVFDKDEFPDSRFDNAVASIAEEDAKFKSGVHPHWYAAWSNEAFELWYLLHFKEALGGPIGRNELCRMLSGHFRNELGEADGYRKNDSRMFMLLESRMSMALRRGKRAFDAWKGKAPHECNPATRVFELVNQLQAYL